MSAYELYLFVHLAAATIWVGAGFLMVVSAARISVARDRARMIAYAGDAEWLGLRLFVPANIVTLVSAVLLVREGPWDYGQLFVQLGLGGFAVSFLTGALFFGPQWSRVTRLAAIEGAGSPSVERRLRRLLVVTGFDLGLLLGIFFEMTVKPTGADGGALFVTAALPVLGAAVGGFLARAQSASRAGSAVAEGLPERAGP